MITMKGFFLFIAINVFVWNSVVYAGKDKLKIAENIYEIDIIVGEYRCLNEYKDKVLIISNLLTNMEHYINNSKLMYLAKKYHKIGLRVLAFFSDSLNNLEGTEDEPKRHNIDFMKENKIEIVYGDGARELFKYLNNRNDDECSSINDSHTFIVGRNIDDVEPGLLMDHGGDSQLLCILQPWNYTKNVDELLPKYFNGDSVRLEEYQNEVIIVSFIYNLVAEFDKNKFQTLIHLANNFKSFDLKILIIFGYSIVYHRQDLEIWRYMIKNEVKLHLYYQSIDSEILMEFFKLKIQLIHSSRDEIEDVFINKDGDIMEFKVDSSIEITETTLIRYLEKWSCPNIVYELKIQNYNRLSVPMKNYRNKALIVSFMRDKYNMYYETEYYKEKLQWLIHLANNFKSFDLKILIIMDLSNQIQQERYEQQKMYTLLSKNKKKAKVHLFKDDEDSDILMHFLKLKVQVLESTRDEMGEFFINENWNVMEFKVNSSIKEIKEMLEKMEHVIKEKHDVNTDLTL